MKADRAMKTLNIFLLILSNYAVAENSLNVYSKVTHQRISKGRDT